jgi:hypothetical protein
MCRLLEMHIGTGERMVSAAVQECLIRSLTTANKLVTKVRSSQRQLAHRIPLSLRF